MLARVEQVDHREARVGEGYGGCVHSGGTSRGRRRLADSYKVTRWQGGKLTPSSSVPGPWSFVLHPWSFVIRRSPYRVTVIDVCAAGPAIFDIFPSGQRISRRSTVASAGRPKWMRAGSPEI